MRCELYQRPIGSLNQMEKPTNETWCRTHGVPKDSRPCLLERVDQLESALVAIIDAHDAKDLRAIEDALMVGRGLTF